ncbi:reverse transcriptase [Prevotella amnii DNF00058]|uniref:RNA-directed DNA polymerase n=2 Tax=Prevotella amnii TaxID=419005 RepID=A0A096C5K1_9BACT|nr:reverse transcriptase [Prevotella amnii DNF00058]
MDKEQIKQIALHMESRKDLLNLLNRIKRDEMEELGFADKFHPFTARHMNYYCNPKNAFHRYRQFKIKKKSRGFRQITAPRNRSFMFMLDCLNEVLKAVYTPSQYVMGFTEGRSVVTNAAMHKGANYVFNIDLKDFFPSIEQPRVWKRLQLQPFNFPVPVASAIAGLCSMKETREMLDGTKKDFYVLPQGAPTSPIITNMICDKLDHRLGGLARRFGLNYTRYADDITFSSMHNVFQENSDFRKELVRIISDQRFVINDKKTRLQKRGSRQEITGIIISDRLNVSQKYVRDIRNILYMWEKYGYSVAYAKFFPKYKEEKGHVKKGNPDLVNVIDGKLMYLKMVKGEEDSVYKRLYAKFQNLVAQMRNPKKTNDKHITYIETMPLLDFEKKIGTSVEIVIKPKDETGSGNTEKGKGRFAYYLLAGTKQLISINRYLSETDIDTKDKLAISQCRDEKGKEFMLIHRLGIVTVPPPKPVDIDELNNELDALLST